MHLVDSSALVALLTDERTADWVENTLNSRRKLGGVFINQIVFSEICALFNSEAEVFAKLRDVVERADLTWSATFPAGKAYRLYKSRGGRKPRMLPDFLIAAHAKALGWTLITNNAADVKNYFPGLSVLEPD
jgi:predicted nucleic acid-binding protein